LLFHFWLALVLFDGAVLIVWLLITAAWPLMGMLLAVPALVLAVAPDVVAYVAVYLRFDTTWYVISDRSVRIRRGIWIIRETTLTFENIQNVTVRQGPLQRYFGIANVYIETAGGGSAAAGAHGASSTNAHQGIIEGISNAARIRDLILSRLRISPGAGLGDEPLPSPPTATAWTAEHLALLREIRDSAQTLVQAR
jgi:membrane protein YdbS with pleckstrin-like domain